MRILISIILISFFLMVPEVYAKSGNRVVAFVNDDVITLYELNNKIEEMTGKKPEELQSENEQEFFKIRKTVLDGMIIDRLSKEKIKELDNISVTKEDIDNYVENIKDHYKMTQEELIAQLKKEGLTYDKYRKQVKDDLERRRLVAVEIADKMIIGEDQIAEYYKSHKKDYEKPGKVHIASIFLVPGTSGMPTQPDELQKKGKEILSRLKKGEAFADLAREFSNGPGAEEGGDLGDIPLTDVAPKIMKVIDSLKEGEVSSLIDMGNRLQIIKLIKRTDKGWVPLEKVKDDIEQLLSDKEIQKRYNEYMEKLKKQSYIKIIL